MRIRKNVRLSSFMPAELIKAYDCQLNQSPWDVIDFSEETETTLHQFERENSFTEGDGGLENFNGDIGGSGTSLKEKAEKEKVVVNVEDMDLENEFVGLKESYSSKNNDDDITEKMQATTLREKPTGRGSRFRARKGKASTCTSKQDEFYYYSGFGPSWRKNRSAQGQGNKNVVIIDEHNDEEKNKIMNAKTDKVEVENNDEETEDEIGSKKRKKSVKARSLQSLM